MKEKLMRVIAWLKADRRRLIGAAFVVFLLLVGTFRLASVGKNKVTYQTSTVTKGTIVSSVSASGQILTSNLANVSSQATGVVKAVYVKDSDKIFAGQKIAEIELDSDGALANAKAWVSLVSAQNGVNAANNNYRLTQATLEKVYDEVKGHDTDETFAQKETRTKAEVANDNAFDALKSVSASLTSAALAYRVTSPLIVAPMTGTIDNITITPGLVLTNSSSTTTTTSSNRVAVVRAQGNPLATFNLSEVDVARVKPEQKVTMTLDAVAGKTFTGRVLTVDKIGTVSSGVTNYPVLVAFDIPSEEVLPNMAATASIILEAKTDVLLVPSEAVQASGDTYSVRILKNGSPEEVTVEVGLSSDTQTEITSGLKEGDVVVTSTRTSTSQTGGTTSPFSTFRVGGVGR